jgi:hypothetical protein
MASPVLVNWFDGMESVLEAEAKVAGLLDHASTIGQAREFLVTRVLRALLPTGVHIGSGKIIDAAGNASRQVDIIVYDHRFPMMRLEGGALYFVEGVIATIEVKSTVNTAELRGALENCKSVLERGVHGEHREEAARQMEVHTRLGGILPADAEQRFKYRIQPATYIFAFNSALTFDTTAKAIKDWWNEMGCRNSGYFPLLPRVIVAGGTVGVVNDGRFKLGAGHGTDHVAAIFETTRRFRWLAVHLMDTVNQRLGVRNFGENFDYRISDYFPFDEYLAEIRQAKTAFLYGGITQRSVATDRL